jgi:hypothetical protein
LMICLLMFLYVCSLFFSIVAATTPNFTTQINFIPMLSSRKNL